VLSDSDENVEGRRLLESTIEHVRALKGFIAEHDRVRGEHDRLKRQMTNSLGEVEMLRNLVQQLKVQQDQFSNALSTLTSEIETAATRAQRFVDPSMPRALDIADFIAKVRATQAETLSAPGGLLKNSAAFANEA
jgi:seryl-tRNA synthetase